MGSYMKIAYVLSGGGAKGSYQVGVMKRLHEQGVRPDAIYGTSVGALNAAAYAYGGMDQLEHQWNNVVGKKWYMPWTPSPDVLGFNWLMLLMCADGIYNTKPLRKTLDQTCVGEAICEAIAVRVSLNTGVTDYVSNRKVGIKDFVDGVQGSATIPGMMSPIGEWVDGGVREVAPIRKAIQDGADKIYVMMANPIVENPTELFDIDRTSPFLKFLSAAYRAIDGVMTHEIFFNDVRDVALAQKHVSVEVYAPKVVPYGTLEFDPAKIKNSIKLGYEAEPLELPDWVYSG